MSRSSCGRICHQETMEVTLHSYAKGSFGLVLHESQHSSGVSIFISYIEKGSPAERSGVLQVGDRVLAINSWRSTNGTADDANSIVRQSTSPLILTVQFDVIESALPREGVFNVKLAKRGNNLGIIVRSETENKKGEPVIISEVRTGSVAYRCGSLQSGDRILAVDNIPLDSCTVEEAMRLLQRSGEVVKLRVAKCSNVQSTNCNTTVQSLTYSITLNRNGGPLGITIASSGEKNEPVTISQLAFGGLAQRTGALRVGDQILAVNNESVDGMRVAEVMHLLQQSDDLVTIKLSRNLDPEGSSGPHLRSFSEPLAVPIKPFRQSHQTGHRLRGQYSACTVGDSYSETSEKIGTPVQSIDSAVESLDDSPGSLIKYQSGIGGTSGVGSSAQQRFALDDQLPNTSHLPDDLSAFEKDNYASISHHCNYQTLGQSMGVRRKFGIARQDQLAWDSSPGSAVDSAALNQRCSCNKNVGSSNPDDWMKVLEALETVGEVEMLRKLDECTGGNGSLMNSGGSPLVSKCHHEPTIAQRCDFRLRCHSPLLTRQQQQYPLAKTKAILMRDSLSPTIRNKFPPMASQRSQFSSTEQIDSLSVSNDSQASTSLCDIPNYMGPPKPPRYEQGDASGFNVLSSQAPPISMYSVQPEFMRVRGMSGHMVKESTPPPKSLMLHELSNKTFTMNTAGITHRVRLRKDPRTNSFGFSVSDGIGDNPGVFINAILPGGPADRCGQILPFDKILQVNDTSLQYLDCDLALPLLNVNEIEMVLYRERTDKTLRDADESCQSNMSLSLRDSAV